MRGVWFRSAPGSINIGDPCPRCVPAGDPDRVTEADAAPESVRDQAVLLPQGPTEGLLVIADDNLSKELRATNQRLARQRSELRHLKNAQGALRAENRELIATP